MLRIKTIEEYMSFAYMATNTNNLLKVCRAFDSFTVCSMTKEKSNERKNVHTSFYRFSVTSFNFFLSLSLLRLYNCFRFVVHRGRGGGEGRRDLKKAEKIHRIAFSI